MKREASVCQCSWFEDATKILLANYKKKEKKKIHMKHDETTTY